MAVVSGVLKTVHVLEGTAWSGHPVYEVAFDLGGQTYAQANNGILSAVAALIKSQSRNGKTVNLKAAMPGRPAKSNVDQSELWLKTVAIAGADITFEVANADSTTEFPDATLIPALSRPFTLLVLCTET